MMFGSNSIEEATLYYLYMMADGDISYSEEKMFDSICKDLSVGAEDKKTVIEKCKKFAANESDIFSVMVREKIDEQTGKSWWGFGLRDSSSLARIVWNLVNLGYADSYYSDEEKKIVEYLLDKWSVDQEIYQEMLDTADTMLALTKQKEWASSTLAKGKERDNKNKEIDEELAQLLEDIELSIEELSM